MLVVDDEPPIRKLLRMGLTAQGYQMLEAANGKAALDLLARAPDLIILDLGLPISHGHELLRTIRARNEGVPVVRPVQPRRRSRARCRRSISALTTT